MLVDIQNNRIDLELVSMISQIYINRRDLSYFFEIYLLNQKDPVIIDIQNEEKCLKDLEEEIEILHQKLVFFWQIAKKQTKIIKIDS